MILDEMELWQVGAALGMTTDEGAAKQATDARAAIPREYLEARERAVAEGRPLPPPPDVLGAARGPSTNDLFKQVPQVTRN